MDYEDECSSYQLSAEDEEALLFKGSDDGTDMVVSKSSLLSTSKLSAACALLTIVAVAGSSQLFSVISSNTKLYTDDPCASMELIATNEYGVFSAPYPFLQNGEILLEPYKLSAVSISGSPDEIDSYTFGWTIGEQEYEGSFISVNLTSTGTLPVSIEVVDASGEQLCVYDTTAYVKYVKRELRTLTTADRDKVLDAAYALWRYNESEGKELFGDKYVPLQTFVEEHALASNDIMCDQYHEGTGFLPHHLALALAFEGSVRTVDPSVTIPYWDFTIDGQYVTNKNGKPSDMLEFTPFFSAEWFGSVDENHHVADGRWAHALMPTTSDPSLTHNSYGYIRSYWNNNNDPEISRALFDTCGVEPIHKTIPNCKIHFAVLDSDSLSTFQSLSPGDGHGPLHVHTGGVWGGCSEAYNGLISKWDELMNTDVTEEELIAAGMNPTKFFNKWGTSGQRMLMLDTAVMGEYFHIYRSLWRSHMCAADKVSGYLVCPESCSTDTDFENCTCKVDALVSGETTTDNLLGCVLNDDNLVFFKAVFPDEFLEDLVTMAATASVLEGEMVESASTADPLFWFIHPVIERLLQAKRLPDVKMMGSSEFSKWAVVDGSNETFNEYSYYSFDADTVPSHPDGYVCQGHLASDRALPVRLSFPDSFNFELADSDGDGMISNIEFLMALNPNDPELNDYVFDNFLWDHCL